jgi:hypothetical protein
VTEDKDDKRETFWQRTFNDPTAFFTLWVAAFTGVLGFSTIGLWFVNRTAANAALRQANVMIAVESPIPLIMGFNIVQFSQIPGETVVADPYRGPIQPNCRFLFCVENKGRTPLPLLELCIEKFAGTALPQKPIYSHAVPWELILEKGPKGDFRGVAVTSRPLGKVTRYAAPTEEGSNLLRSGR